MRPSIPAILLLVAVSSATPAATLERCSEVELKVIGLFSVGTASLHLVDCSDTGRVLETIPKQFSLKLDRDMAGEDLIESANELLVENLDDVDGPDELPQELACLANAYVDAVEGERFDVVYEPGNRLALYRNDELLTECPDQGRGHEYFKIWFGEEPFNQRMKKRLLERANGN
ncbi:MULTISPECIES: chalcone isomerase family protein [unclassified Wenzhouxiangella]|uniref:chalcone isomerase family protein n=1 Tax=unclassified Wenzhouxiangella TaxID=2613841 RepID=UPI000E329560|nr:MULTISPECIES: chalcone isomerase family protein [unclassified Wenzhouxiangella]RFF28772.1 hypothetical protein DZK25_01115 [Wenzhouxiangella sp. 15181]RFP67824.1 hypothetical protein DZK26_10855 [Wenzhouxiangella sp. 15190]